MLRPNMNVLHKIAFNPLDSAGTVANCGPDYAMLPTEVQVAFSQGRAEGFEIHCIYNQQTEITPQLFFSHQLKAGDPRTLATSVRHVLDAMAAAPRPLQSCRVSA